MKIKGDFVKLIPEIQDRENKKMRVYIQIDNVEAKVDQNEIEKNSPIQNTEGSSLVRMIY